MKMYNLLIVLIPLLSIFIVIMIVSFLLKISNFEKKNEIQSASEIVIEMIVIQKQISTLEIKRDELLKKNGTDIVNWNHSDQSCFVQIEVELIKLSAHYNSLCEIYDLMSKKNKDIPPR